MKRKAAIAGISGYIGGELYRLLLSHPLLEVTAVFGSESEGKRVSDVHPGLGGRADSVIRNFSQFNPADFDVVFSCLPQGEASKMWQTFKNCRLFIDLSADFRVRDRQSFTTYYPEHEYNEASREFTYGIPELFRDKIRSARYISSPGCFATAAILAAAPIISRKLTSCKLYFSSVTGSSGSGAKPKDKTHHPYRNDSFFAYEPLKHRHIPEITQALSDKFGGGCDIALQVHSGPFIRGIHSTVMFPLRDPSLNVLRCISDYYRGEKFIAVQEQPPNVKWVAGTNMSSMSAQQTRDTAVVFVAIDNLIKGGAGQAVQSMNIACGFEEETGLPVCGKIV